MADRVEYFNRILFATLAISYCIILAVRPIPSLSSHNDTGRYVLHLEEHSRGNIHVDSLRDRLSYGIFFSVISPGGLLESKEAFLFLSAIFFPLTFVLFSNFTKSSFLWMIGLLFSVYALGSMTNALRQTFATFVFIGSIALLRKRNPWSFALAILASFAHTTALAYFPLWLWMGGGGLSKKVLKAIMGLIMAGLIAFFLVYGSVVVQLYQVVDKFRDIFMIMSGEELKLSFLLFIVLPLLFIYGARRIFENEDIGSDEKKAFIYSITLIILSYTAIPIISYRFGYFAVTLQVFLITISARPGFRLGFVAMIGFVLHLIILLTMSNHFEVLING